MVIYCRDRNPNKDTMQRILRLKKNIQAKQNKTKNLKATTELILCWLSTAMLGAYAEVWLVCTGRFHWEKLIFLLQAVVNWRKLLVQDGSSSLFLSLTPGTLPGLKLYRLCACCHHLPYMCALKSLFPWGRPTLLPLVIFYLLFCIVI